MPPKDRAREAARGSPRAALELVRQHLSRGTLDAKDIQAALGYCGTWVRFERGRDDVTGPTFGPFAWVQQTYLGLHVDKAPATGEENAELASFDVDAGEWFLTEAAGEHEGEFYSDFVVFCDFQGVADRLEDHDCRAARHTMDPQDSAREVRWDDASRSWVRTGRRWLSDRGHWTF